MSEQSVSAEMMERAMRPRLVFGDGILGDKSREWGEYTVLTQPEVWAEAGTLLAVAPARVEYVESMDRAAVVELDSRLPKQSAVVGIGGGMCMDMAKYAAWRRGVMPILCPSIASVDACVTNTIAVRDQGKVRYIGFVTPAEVISDFALMRRAPKRLNRAGLGDILSIHTGVFDWRLAAARGEVSFRDEIAAAVLSLVDGLEARVAELRSVSDSALRWLIEAYAVENEQCLQAGHSRPEEGSEHFLAYNIEHLTGKRFVHGELVCLGVLVMSRLQNNQPGRVLEILESSGVRYQPSDLDLTRRDLERALVELPGYVKAEGLFHSVASEKEMNGRDLEVALDGLAFA